jgi:periplasmic protein TonB
MFICDREQRLFLGSLLLSLGLHLGLAGLGVMTGWGRTLTSPTVLEVQLVAPAGGSGGAPEKAGASAALAAPAPQLRATPAPVRKPKLAKPVAPLPVEKPQRELTPIAVAKAPAASLALATPLRAQAELAREFPGGTGVNGAARGGESGAVSRGQAGSGAGTGSGLGSGQGSGPAQVQYLGLIRNRIIAHRNYPAMARQRHQEGVVRVRFCLSATGSLSQGVEVVRPSGFGLLDEQARQCVAAAAPFPPIPREMNRDRLTIEVPIVYKLTEGD